MVDDLNHEIKRLKTRIRLIEQLSTTGLVLIGVIILTKSYSYISVVVYFCGRHYPFAFAIGQGALATSIEGEDLPGQGGGAAYGGDSFREGRYPGGINEIGECLARLG